MQFKQHCYYKKQLREFSLLETNKIMQVHISNPSVKNLGSYKKITQIDVVVVVVAVVAVAVE